MSVHVVVASKYGSTREIAEAIATELRAGGHVVELLDAEDVRGFEGADAVVLGSAIYAGHWLKPAHRLLETCEEQLKALPTWVFSSGPIGDPALPRDAEPTADMKGIRAIHPRDTAVFAGRLDHELLSIPERMMVKALHAPQGDFRDWDAIRAWGRKIATSLQRVPA